MRHARQSGDETQKTLARIATGGQCRRAFPIEVAPGRTYPEIARRAGNTNHKNT